jgi:hypothetical protein
LEVKGGKTNFEGFTKKFIEGKNYRPLFRFRLLYGIKTSFFFLLMHFITTCQLTSNVLNPTQHFKFYLQQIMFIIKYLKFIFTKTLNIEMHGQFDF